MLYSSRTVASPLGPLTLKARNAQLCAIAFGAAADAPDEKSPADTSVLEKSRQELAAYFEGKLEQFSIPLAPEGTEFQRAAWKALEKIPYGCTRSYKEQAEMLGRPKASRAVGSANRLNPLPIVIPCHRVVGSDGQLVGYAGGIKIKEFLLALEGVRLPLEIDP